jgi:drug/metabolite transporter (DMT)-like permease
MMIGSYFYIRSFGAFPMDIPRKYHHIIIIRAVAGFTGIQGMFGSVKYLPVSTAGCIFFTQPIWTALLAWVFAKESLSVYDIISIIAAFIGVLIINNPWQTQLGSQVLTDNETSGGYIDSKEYSPRDKLIGSLLALIGSFGAATAFLCMRIMKSEIHYSVSPFWFSIGCTTFSPLLAAT